MSNLQLQFLDLRQEPVALTLTEDGIRFAVDDEHGPHHVPNDDQHGHAQAKVVATELGSWLHVYGERNAVHLNGRPVYRLAWVRAGDRIFVDGHSFYIVSEPAEIAPGATGDESAMDASLSQPTFSLRGLSGEHYGQSLPVRGEMRIGNDAAADIRLAGVTGESHVAVIAPGQNGLTFAVEPSHKSQVNGRNVRNGLLEVGDQWVLDGRFRFVLESPDFVIIHRPEVEDEELALQRLSEADRIKREERRRLMTRLGWLVGICALLSAAMVAMILYAPR